MTTALAVLAGALAAALGAVLLGPRARGAAGPSGGSADPVRRELANLRQELAAGELTTHDYRLLRERLAARMALGAASATRDRSRAAGRWRWPLAGVAAAILIAATLIPAVRDRSPGGFGTGNDFSDQGTIDSGSAAWRAAERAVTAGDLRGAVSRYRVAVAFLPDIAELRARFGFALAQSGRTAEARRQLQMAVRAQPRLPDARLYLGAVLLRRGQRREAARQWRAFLDLRPRGRDAELVRRMLRRLG